jgi:hypothetical protein
MVEAILVGLTSVVALIIHGISGPMRPRTANIGGARNKRKILTEENCYDSSHKVNTFDFFELRPQDAVLYSPLWS